MRQVFKYHTAANESIQGQQYVAAGELVALQTMTNVLTYLKMEKIDIQKVRTQIALSG